MTDTQSITRRRVVGHIAATGTAAAGGGQAAVALANAGDAEKTNNAPAAIRIGAASCVINPQIGDWVQAASVKKRATEIRDNLEANGLYLSDGKKQILLVSCDLAVLTSPRVSAMREAVGQAIGMWGMIQARACASPSAGGRPDVSFPSPGICTRIPCSPAE